MIYDVFYPSEFTILIIICALNIEKAWKEEDWIRESFLCEPVHLHTLLRKERVTGRASLCNRIRKMPSGIKMM